MSDFPGEAWLLNWIRERFPRLAQPDLGLGALLKPVAGSTRQVAFGSGTVVFTAADASAQVTVPHGLGKTPAVVLCGAKSPANARVTIQETASADDTDLYVKGFQSGSIAITANQNFYWVALA